MKPYRNLIPRQRIVVAWITLLAITLACTRSLSDNPASNWQVPEQTASVFPIGPPTLTPFLPATRLPGAPILTPTPDSPHTLPEVRTEEEQYIVQAGDTLGLIAQRFGVSLEQVIQSNQIANPNILEIGQSLTIPVPDPQNAGPAFKIIPDSELVYGPASATFDLENFILSHNGYLATYHEDVEDHNLSGANIIQRIAEDYSLNPRLLLAVLQYQSPWLTRQDLDEFERNYPMSLPDSRRKGLYKQLAWAANNLNRGYYLWKVNGTGTWVLNDGSVVPIDATINAGTAGIQYFFAQLYDRSGWEAAVSEKGVFATYQNLFGYPFDFAVHPLIPFALQQPRMQLPFESGVSWAFTGGPHGGWGDGAAWAALDFAPPGEALGCVPSDEWVIAVADGVIIRASNGAVIQDIDGQDGVPADGLEQTGWVVLYMHIATRERVEAGDRVKAGDRIGHPSCEGGISSGTHLHIARRYNGEWIPADQTLPFILDGWVSRGSGSEYDGYLERNGHAIEAWEGWSADNAIQR